MRAAATVGFSVMTAAIVMFIVNQGDVLFPGFFLDEVDEHRSEEHTSELQSRETISYAVFCLKKKKQQTNQHTNTPDVFYFTNTTIHLYTPSVYDK